MLNIAVFAYRRERETVLGASVRFSVLDDETALAEDDQGCAPLERHRIDVALKGEVPDRHALGENLDNRRPLEPRFQPQIQPDERQGFSDADRGRHFDLPASVGHQHRVGRGFIDGALQVGGIDMNDLGMAGGRACSRDTGGEQNRKQTDRSHVHLPSRFTLRGTPTTVRLPA